MSKIWSLNFYREFKMQRNDIINTYDYYRQIMIMVIKYILPKLVRENQSDKGICSLGYLRKDFLVEH